LTVLKTIKEELQFEPTFDFTPQKKLLPVYSSIQQGSAKAGHLRPKKVAQRLGQAQAKIVARVKILAQAKIFAKLKN
jgi:hypothetical protein